MSDREKEIIEKFKKAIPQMSEFDKGFFLGKAEGLAEAKKNKQTQSVKE